MRRARLNLMITWLGAKWCGWVDFDSIQYTRRRERRVRDCFAGRTIASAFVARWWAAQRIEIWMGLSGPRMTSRH